MHSLVLLQLKGVFCCLETPEDQLARMSVSKLTSKFGWRVQWHQIDDRGNPKWALTGMDNTHLAVGLVHDVMGTVVSSTKKIVGRSNTSHAMLSLIDTFDGPALRLVSTMDSTIESWRSGTSWQTVAENSLSFGSRRGSKVILLSSIGAVQPSGNCGFKLYGHRNTVYGHPIGDRHQGPKLLRCDLMGGTNDSAAASFRDEFVEHLANVIEWDTRERKAECHEEETRTPSKITPRLSKWELDMQQRKMEREERMAKYRKASLDTKRGAVTKGKQQRSQ